MHLISALLVVGLFLLPCHLSVASSSEKVEIFEEKVGGGPSVVLGDYACIFYNIKTPVNRREYTGGKVVASNRGERFFLLLKLDDSIEPRGLKTILEGMKVNGKRKARIPESLANHRNNTEKLPLEAEVELIEISKDPKATKQKRCRLASVPGSTPDSRPRCEYTEPLDVPKTKKADLVKRALRMKTSGMLKPLASGVSREKLPALGGPLEKWLSEVNEMPARLLTSSVHPCCFDVKRTCVRLSGDGCENPRAVREGRCGENSSAAVWVDVTDQEPKHHAVVTSGRNYQLISEAELLEDRKE